MAHRNALGRGLDSLISMDDTPARGSSAINEIPLEQITANPEQPRRDFSPEALADLASSIREVGIVQPLSLRKTGPASYQIIAGERRYRAAKLAGLTTVPAYIRTATDTELTEMALIENIQREDLNAIEIALTFRKLMDQYSMTQERLSERIGKKRATIANFLRLLKLPADVQLGLRNRKIDMGHARALLSIDDPHDQLKLYKKILAEELSVRRVEQLAKAMQLVSDSGNESATRQQGSLTGADGQVFDFDLLRHHLSASFSTPVKVQCDDKGHGKITFSFSDADQLQRILLRLDALK